jgi:hypothetical protein
MAVPELVPEEIDIAKIREILTEMRSMPEADPRSAEKILDDFYDEHGLPK